MLGKILVTTKNLFDISITHFCEFTYLSFLSSLFYNFPAFFKTYYSSSNFKGFTDTQEVGSGVGENNSMCQEHPTFCFTIIQFSLSTLAFCIYCHWAVPSLVSDWAFAESGCIFAHWEPGLIPLNKTYSRKIFLNKIKQAKKKKKAASLLIYILLFEIAENHESSWASFYFVTSMWNA